jgi:hypothetical protein
MKTEETVIRKLQYEVDRRTIRAPVSGRVGEPFLGVAILLVVGGQVFARPRVAEIKRLEEQQCRGRQQSGGRQR